jgi:hypothetical protein
VVVVIIDVGGNVIRVTRNICVVIRVGILKVRVGRVSVIIFSYVIDGRDIRDVGACDSWGGWERLVGRFGGEIVWGLVVMLAHELAIVDFVCDSSVDSVNVVVFVCGRRS